MHPTPSGRRAARRRLTVSIVPAGAANRAPPSRFISSQRQSNHPQARTPPGKHRGRARTPHAAASARCCDWQAP
ncbi:hypothetical protein GSH04_19310 [Burkholderia pseudomallei]|nr:hypothetical protein [Burkholderia pseudomallei]MBM5634236.1 hypothetical protein [Burkholderia pseudomallei]MBM5660339.1 hypothetical protein [Burkholderia pseudomallei]